MNHVIEINSSDDKVQSHRIRMSGPIIELLSSDDDGHGSPQYIKSHALFLQPPAIKKRLKVGPKPPRAAYRVRMLILGRAVCQTEPQGLPPTQFAHALESIPPVSRMPWAAVRCLYHRTLLSRDRSVGLVHFSLLCEPDTDDLEQTTRIILISMSHVS